MAGAKAGILGGIFFAAVAGLANWALMEAFSNTALQVLSTISYCSGTEGTPQACLSTLINTNIPTLAVLQGASGILFGALYGMYFEFLPGNGYRIKAVAAGVLMLVVLLFLGLAGITIDRTQQVIMYGVDVVCMVGFVVITAHFYREYTREVKFESPNPEKLRLPSTTRTTQERRRPSPSTQTTPSGRPVRAALSMLGSSAEGFRCWTRRASRRP